MADRAPIFDSDLEVLLDRGYRYALSLTGERSAAEDVLQDAWVSLLRGGTARGVGYLFRAIRSRFVDRYRRSKVVVLAEVEDEPMPGADLDASLLHGDALERALAVLGAEEREAIFLSLVEGYSSIEIGELTGRSPGAVRTLLCRARKKVRDALESQEKARLSI